jgi:hypothetical protein
MIMGMRERFMANEKNPSIYFDRGTIGSSTELDEYGVWVKSEPQDFSSARAETASLGDDPIPDGPVDFSTALEDLPDFGDSGAQEDFDFSGENSGKGDIDFDIPLEISAEDEMDDFFEDPSGGPKDFSLEEDFGSGEPSLDADIAGTGVLNVFPELEDPEKEPALEASEQISSGEELPTKLLMRIVGELSSIKEDLSILKRELSAIHSGGIPGEQAGTQGRGFFDAGEDEKIALTGDELDNILHTADFTEETGADAVDNAAGDFSAEDSGEFPPPVTDTLFGEEIPETGLSEETVDFAPEEPLPAEPAEEEITLEENLVFEAPVEEAEISLSPDDALSIEDALGRDIELLSDEASLDLQELRETGVEPMTPAPENTSYLETEPERDVFDDLSLDMSDPFGPDPVGDETVNEDLAREPEPPVEPLTVALDLDESLPEEETTGIFDESAPPGEEEEIRIDIPVDGITEAIPNAEFEEVSPPVLEKTAEDELDEPFEQFIPEGFEDETVGDAPPEEALGDFEEPVGLPELTKEPEPDTGEAAAPDIPANLKRDLKSVLSYMDQLLESLPEEKIEEFAKSEYFDTYKKVFEELGIS